MSHPRLVMDWAMWNEWCFKATAFVVSDEVQLLPVVVPVAAFLRTAGFYASAISADPDFGESFDPDPLMPVDAYDLDRRP
jgi:hypothetical protein